jgi:Transposase and inactivated derivatives
MKAYGVDLRKRVIEFVREGGDKGVAIKQFKLSRATLYRYLKADEDGTLEPKETWGKWRKLDPKKLEKAIARRPDATLFELAKEFDVTHNAIWVRLNFLGITLKKTHKISGKK